ncbi:caspase family protein [Nocardioides speluncae]|uniref:caspase family protein n=1 Tax=Nocardioides speluncae TaxID=2670337 RepID=UPI000D691C22|nr:caspase family protein [Nocardioides speluncae]
MTGERHALIVAVDQYEHPGLGQLAAPAYDAAALGAVLDDPAIGGYDVQTLGNPTSRELMLGLEDFFADRDPTDLLLVHVSCHGIKNPAGELFLAASDTQPDRLASTGVPAAFVNRQLADSRAQRVALFLDCCYGGAFPRGMVVRSVATAPGRDLFAQQDDAGGGRGRVVVTASSAMEYAFEEGKLASTSQQGPSVFTSAVVDALRSGEADMDGDGWVGLGELFEYVASRVRRSTTHQTPHMWVFGAQGGELLIARSPSRAVRPTPLPPQIAEALSAEFVGTRLGLVGLLRERAAADDLGQALAAREALQQLVDDDSRRVSTTAAEAIAETSLRVEPPVLSLGAEPVEVRLVGPPLARAVTARASAPWLRVDLGEDSAAVSAGAGPGEYDAAVRLEGPAGVVDVPVHVSIPQSGSPPAARPAPAPEPPPALPPMPTRPSSSPASEAPAPDLPWWRRLEWQAVVLLAVGNLLAFGIGPAGSGWIDERHGLKGEASYVDGYWFAELLLVVAACLVLAWTRSRPAAYGAAAGAAAYLTVAGIVIGLSGLAASDWLLAATALAIVAITASAVAIRPVLPRARSLDLGGTVLVVLAAVSAVVSDATTGEPNWLEITRGFSLAGAAALLVLGLLAAAVPWTGNARGWRGEQAWFYRAALTTYVALGAVNLWISEAEFDLPQETVVFAISSYVLVLSGATLAYLHHTRA